MIILNILGGILKLIFTFILIFGIVFTLIIGGLIVREMIVYHNYYAKTLQVEIPKRDADFSEDTHGGFLGEGDTVKIYELTDKEIEKLNEDIKTNDHWKPIDDALYSIPWMNYNEKIPQIENGWYCFYNKQTKTFELPGEDTYSYNYIVCLYSEEKGKLWIYELDT